MSSVDAGSQSPETDWSEWVGRSRTMSSVLHAERVVQMAATLDLPQAPEAGAPLPSGWHWLFFNDAAHQSEIGVDGHPQRGGFLPPIALPRRMWAGGRLRFEAPLPVGAEAERRSEILKIESKRGRNGQLVFVILRHRLYCGGRLAIEEEQDLVYREVAAPGTAAPRLAPAPTAAARSEVVEPDSVLLFRYSALTFNGHRIHYDRRYATEEEGYRDLVVHGPLTATLLMGFAERLAGRPLAGFSFRGVAPLFAGAPFRLETAAATGEGRELWAKGPQGELAMSAAANF